jgi:hypothetical protein
MTVGPNAGTAGLVASLLTLAGRELLSALSPTAAPVQIVPQERFEECPVCPDVHILDIQGHSISVVTCIIIAFLGGLALGPLLDLCWVSRAGWRRVIRAIERDIDVPQTRASLPALAR